jgi:hypothetical protein
LTLNRRIIPSRICRQLPPKSAGWMWKLTRYLTNSANTTYVAGSKPFQYLRLRLPRQTIDKEPLLYRNIEEGREWKISPCYECPRHARAKRNAGRSGKFGKKWREPRQKELTKKLQIKTKNWPLYRSMAQPRSAKVMRRAAARLPRSVPVRVLRPLRFHVPADSAGRLRAKNGTCSRSDLRLPPSGADGTSRHRP